MTPEDKELLVKDLCARMPYGVKVLNSTYVNQTVQTLLGRMSEDTFTMRETYKDVSGDDFRMVKDGVNYTGHIDYIKPYLRSLKSMTEEERNEFFSLADNSSCLNIGGNHDEVFVWDNTPVLMINWLDKKMFDYRTDDDGLTMIEKGLAVEATEGMYDKI